MSETTRALGVELEHRNMRNHNERMQKMFASIGARAMAVGFVMERGAAELDTILQPSKEVK